MTANRTEPSARGGVTGAPAPRQRADRTSSSHNSARRRMRLGLAPHGRGDDVPYEIDDEIGVAVQQHEMTRQKTVFDALR